LKEPYLVDGLRAHILIGGRKLVRDFRSMSVYELSTTRLHLATRAWATQEKTLPPRNIHFGHRGAFWECRGKIANEFLPDGCSSRLVSGLIDESARKDFRRWWWNVLQLYSAANLTYSQDKLPALSRIARRIHEERREQYIAGTWRDEDIEGQLCWRAIAPRRRPPWRPPSWSWASIDGQVSHQVRQWHGILEDTDAHVLDVKITLLGQDPFGEGRSGCMRISCSGMVTARFSQGDTVKIELGDTANTTNDNYPVSKDDLDDVDDVDDVDDDLRKDSDFVYLLPQLGGETGRGFCPEEEEENMIMETAIVGLVLRKEGRITGRFCSIGMFTFLKDSNPWKSEGKSKEHLEPFLEVLKQSGSSVAKRACAELIENVKYPEERYMVHVL
jgi:hypothetical protein